MSGEFSRSHWDQIVKRVRQAQFVFDEKWKCLLCGHRYKHAACPHTHEENVAIIELVKTSS